MIDYMTNVQALAVLTSINQVLITAAIAAMISSKHFDFHGLYLGRGHPSDVFSIAERNRIHITQSGEHYVSLLPCLGEQHH